MESTHETLVNAWRLEVADASALDERFPVLRLEGRDPKALHAQVGRWLDGSTPCLSPYRGSDVYVMGRLDPGEARDAVPSARVERVAASELPAHVLLHLLTCQAASEGAVPLASAASGQTFIAVDRVGLRDVPEGVPAQVVALSPAWSSGALLGMGAGVALLDMPVATFTPAALADRFEQWTPDGKRCRDPKKLPRWQVGPDGRLFQDSSLPFEACYLRRQLKGRKSRVAWLDLQYIPESKRDDDALREALERTKGSKTAWMARVVDAVSALCGGAARLEQERVVETERVALVQNSPKEFAQGFPERAERHGFTTLQVCAPDGGPGAWQGLATGNEKAAADARRGLELVEKRARTLGLAVERVGRLEERDPGQPLVAVVPDDRRRDDDAYRPDVAGLVQHVQPHALGGFARSKQERASGPDRLIGELMVKDDVLKGRVLTFAWAPAAPTRVWCAATGAEGPLVAWADLGADGSIGFGCAPADDPQALLAGPPCFRELAGPGSGGVDYCVSRAAGDACVEPVALRAFPDVRQVLDALACGDEAEVGRALSKSAKEEKAILRYRYDGWTLALPDGRLAYRVGDRHSPNSIGMAASQRYRAVRALRGDVSWFPEMLGAMDVDVVRGSRATVRPFALKHLREWLVMSGHVRRS